MQDQQLMGLLLIPVSLLGVICNLSIFIASSKIKSLNPSFAILVATMSAIDLLGSCLFLFYVTPMIVFDLKTWKSASHHCGFMLMLAYDNSMNTHILIVFNRFLAVFMPLSYQKVLGPTTTKFLVTLSILITLAQIVTFFLIINCHLYYNNDYWMFYYTDLPICWWYAYNLDTNKVIVTASIGVVINSIVLLKVRRTRKKVNRSGMHKKKEMDFLKQTYGQGIYLFVFSIVYCFVSILTENHIIGFLLTTLFFNCLFTINGLFVITLNSEIRGAIGLDPKKTPGSSIFVESRVSTQVS